MVNIIEVKDEELLNRINDHDKIGGALRISVFEIKENYENFGRMLPPFRAGVER